MEIKPDELLYKLQQHKQLPPAQVLVLYGEEEDYHNSILAAIPDYIFADTAASDRSIESFEKDTNIAELAAVINTYPFFGGKSLVLVRDEGLWGKKLVNSKADGDAEAESAAAKKRLEQLTQIMTDVPEYCFVVISTKGLDRRTKFYKEIKDKALLCACDRLKLRDVQEWLHTQESLYGARFTPDAIGTLMSYLEPVSDDIPLGILRQEIVKLALYAGGRRQWTRQDVVDIFAPLANPSAFAINNAIMGGKLEEALEILAIEAKRGQYNILPIIGMVASKLRQVLRYKELKRQGLDQKAIMDAIGVKNPYAYKYLAQDSRRFSEERVRQALIAIADLNSGLRRGGRSYSRLEEILLQLLS